LPIDGPLLILLHADNEQDAIVRAQITARDGYEIVSVGDCHQDSASGVWTVHFVVRSVTDGLPLPRPGSDLPATMPTTQG
jgi:hypothetical protein